MKRHFFSEKKHFTIVALLYSSFLLGQSTVSGKVVDALGLPLGGVTVSVVGKNDFKITGNDGGFVIKLQRGDALLFSSVGFDEKKLTIADDHPLTVTLAYDARSLQEVLVLGYGTARRKDVTGAVTKITSPDFNTGNMNNALQELQGKVAGLVITQAGDDPNGEPTVRIRGATSVEGQPPLLVIDDVAVDDFYTALSTLNPADVESYDILKDASAAAIYGARGANGVILITTKRAKAGKTEVNYTGWSSVEGASRSMRVLSAEEWRKTAGSLGAGNLDQGGEVDWQRAIERRALAFNHTLSLQGGSGNLSYRGSLSYSNLQGIIKNTGKDVFGGRLTISQKSLSNRLEITYNINASYTQRKLLFDQDATTQSRIGSSLLFTSVIQYLPVWPAYNSDGSYYQVSIPGVVNPLFFVNEVYRRQHESFFQSSVKADYALTRNLKMGVVGALSQGNNVQDYFHPGVAAQNEAATANKRNDNKQNLSGNVHFSYLTIVGKHRLEVTGVYEYNRFMNDGFGVTAHGFLAPELLDNNLMGAQTVTPADLSSYKNEVKLISFLGRLQYNCNDRFLLTANLRRDGSSKFGLNHRWGTFPSLAFAWRISNERFLANDKFLNDLKLRVSYGLTGNQDNIPPYPYQLLYGPTGLYLYNGQFLQSFGVVQESNPDLKWEVRHSFNAGIDFSLLHNKINGTVDFFRDRTSDMLFLYDIPQPPFLTPQVYANAANAKNSGVELTLNTRAIQKKSFEWNVSLNVTTLHNTITNLSGEFKGTSLNITARHYGYANGRGLSGAYVSELKPGYTAGIFWLPQFAGFDGAGHALYDNYDASGKLTGTSTSYTDMDRVFIDPMPRFIWAITNGFNYKKLDLGFLIRGVQGQKTFANSLMNLNSKLLFPSANVSPDALTNGFQDQPLPSTYWLQNASFARLENIVLGYSFRATKSISLLRLYVQANNLFLITPYKGIDPEVRTEGTQRYIDEQTYPKTRSFTIGANINFQ